jgi:hypothetical protein
MTATEINPISSSSRFSAPAVFVIGVWLVMFLSALDFLKSFAVNVPYAEDGMIVPYVTGAERPSWDFFWCEYSNHVIPLPKFVLFLLARCTHDFRTAMYVSVTACAATALLLCLAARSLRGRFSYFDAFFPLGLLHLSHWESFLLGFAIQEIMSTGLLALVLFIILRTRGLPSRKQFITVALCLLFLPVTGASGFIAAPLLMAWLAYGGWLAWRSERYKLSGYLFLQLLLLAAIVLSLLTYIVDFHSGLHWRPNDSPPMPKFSVVFSVLMQAIALGFGRAAAASWFPFLTSDQRAAHLVGITILALVVLGLVLFLRKQPVEERLRKFGLACFLLANFLVVAAIAVGRSGSSGTIGLSPRYSLYSVPLLWAVYFIWELYGSAPARRWVPLGLFVFMCAMFSLNMNMGYASGQARQIALTALQRDIVRPEVPAIEIATSYGKIVSCGHWVYYKQVRHPGGNEQALFAEMVQMLRRANIPKRR